MKQSMKKAALVLMLALAERIVAVSIVYLICLIQLAKGFVGVSCND